MKHICSQKGNSFLTTIFVLVMATVIGLSLISLSINGTIRNEQREKVMQAKVLAEDGMNHLTYKINKELETIIQDVESLEMEKAENLDFMREIDYKNLYRTEFEKVLNKYSCESGNSIVYTSDDHKYEACYDEHNIHNKIIDDTYRLAYFKSTGTAEDVTKTLISGVKLGARFSNYPKELNYVVATTDEGTLMMNGGITINGDIRTDGDVIISDSGYYPLTTKSWVNSVYPSIGGNTTFPSKTGNPRFYNSNEGNLYLINNDQLTKSNKFLNFYEIWYKDIFNTDLINGSDKKDLLLSSDFSQLPDYLFETNRLDLFQEAAKFQSMDISKIVEMGKKVIGEKVKVRRSDSEYTTYKNALGLSILSGSYHATTPTLIKGGIIATLENQPQVTGDFKIDKTGGINVGLSDYTFNGNFYFHDTQVNLTAGSNVTLKGNYYFDHGKSIIESKTTPFRINGGGTNTLDGNFYISEGDFGSLRIFNGSHNIKGTYFLDGDLIIQDTTLKADAVFFVNGDVNIQKTTIKPLNGGYLIIFATGEIQLDYAYDSGTNILDDYYNENQRVFNAFFYSKDKVEVHGTISNIKINGGVIGKHVFLTGIRGDVKKSLGVIKNFPSVESQRNKDSRLVINYNPDIVTTFNQLHNINIRFYDLDLQPPAIMTRKFE